MASTDPDSRDEPYAMLVDVLADPEGAKQRLPRLVGLFDSETRLVRVSAAWACAAVANELDDEDTIEYLVRRLSDRLDGEHASLELTTTLDYVSTRYPEQVERIIDDIDEEAREQGEIPLPRVGNFTRSHYYNDEPSRGGVGRTRVAGSDDAGGPRSTYADTEEETQEERPAGAQSGTDDEEDTEGQEDEDGDEEPFGAMGQERTEVSSIAARSRFDKLHILASRQRTRYADVYDSLVGTGGEEKAVALRLLHRPADRSAWLEYADSVETQLDNWAAVSDHPHVVTVLDYGVEPRPWLATRFAGDSLTEHGRLQPVGLVEDAVELADAVSTLHQNGVVHGGLDPGNVAYPADLVGSGQQQPPLLDNVGLMNAVRFHFQPARHLDPRFAAPEYFDTRYGSIDHATDIYQLGAVLYYMATGRPPYTGTLEEVRERVLEGGVPAASEAVEGVPEALDEVITKAMAGAKLTRYETVEHLQQDLVSIRRDHDG